MSDPRILTAEQLAFCAEPARLHEHIKALAEQLAAAGERADRADGWARNLADEKACILQNHGEAVATMEGRIVEACVTALLATDRAIGDHPFITIDQARRAVDDLIAGKRKPMLIAEVAALAVHASLTGKP